jgi:ketosteroid isomerase-like protein
MIKILRAAALCAGALLLSTPATAQNLSLRAPPWAQPLISADITPTTGGRAALAAEGIDIGVRVTIAPPRGGIARVIRYEARGDQSLIALRRFTGHPSTGWWLWGSDAPTVTHPNAAQRSEIATLARGAIGVGGALAANAGEACPAGEQAFIEIAVEGRSTSLARACVTANDAAGRLAVRLSELAGSRTEEELAAAAVAELIAADRAFAAKAAADGVPAAFNQYAAEDGLIVTSSEIHNGRAGIADAYQDWPANARLEWAPETARVSARGDMGWTWGNSTYVAPDGQRRAGRYVSVWTRDYEGNWRFAFDAPIR